MLKDRCRNRLKELPRRVDIDFLSEARGFKLVDEPFFRGVLKAAVKYTLSESSSGRSIIGFSEATPQGADSNSGR